MKTLKYRITLKDLRMEKKRNLKSNLQFIDFYVEYMKKQGNKTWSKSQGKLINAIYSKVQAK